jgi:HEAT repeat protein
VLVSRPLHTRYLPGLLAIIPLVIASCGPGVSPKTPFVHLSGQQLGALVDSVLTGSAEMRRASLASLDSLGDDRVASMLVDRLRSPDSRTRSEARRVLTKLSLHGGLRSLYAATGDTSVFVRWSVVYALGFRHGEGLDSVLQVASRDPSVAVRRAAVLSIAHLPDSLLPPLLEPLRNDPAEEVRAAVAEALVNAPHADSLLVEMVETDVGMVVTAAVKALGMRRTRSVAAVVGVKLLDGASDTRVAAARALGNIGGEEATVLLLASAADDPLPLVRESAVLGLAQCAPDRVPTLLRERKRAENDVFVRMAWVYALEQIGTEEGRRILGELAVDDPSPEVRAAARAARVR